MLNLNTKTFSLNKETMTVIKDKDDEEINIPFKDFFDEKLNPKKLNLEDDKYNYEILSTFIKTANDRQCYVFKSTKNKVTFSFYILFTDDINIINVEVRKEENNIYTDELYDFLTGVYSRKYLFDLIEKELKNKNPNSRIIMIDLDNFKGINDNYGHLIGDYCLKEISSKLKIVFKDCIFGRYGGDEFLVYVKDITDLDLEKLIKAALKVSYIYKHANNKHIVTCSLGISKNISKRTNLQDLIEESDKALYQAKKRKKNSAKIYDGPIYYGYENIKYKVNTKNKNSQNATLFQEELKKKNKIYTINLVIILLLTLFTIFGFDFLYNFKVNEQTSEIAKEDMSGYSSSISTEVSTKINETFIKLENSIKILDEITSSDEEELLDSMVKSLKKNTLINTPGLLLENGDVYFSSDNITNVASYDFAKKMITDKEKAVSKISYISNQDYVLIGYPYYKETQTSNSDTSLNVVGIISAITPKEFASSLFETIDDSYYVTIVDNTGIKICENSSSSIDKFDSYYNIFNYFIDNKLDSQLKVVKSLLSSDKGDCNIISLGNAKYFVYSKNIGIENWSILFVVPYTSIFKQFGNLILFSLILFNAICILFLVFVIFAFTYFNKTKKRALLSEYYDSTIDSINQKRFILDADTIIKNEKKNEIYICYLNIKRFRYFYNTFGNEANDILLIISHYFQEHLTGVEMISREYTDRFILLLMSKDRNTIYNRIKILANNLNNIEDLKQYGQFSINIGLYKIEDGKGKIHLALDRAKKACETCKQGSERYDLKFFDKKMLESEELESYIEQNQEVALKENKFQVFYQGKYSLHEDKFDSCEALVRWKDDNKGFINTQKFIDVFEGNGFVIKLDLHIFEKVLIDLREYLDKGLEPIPVSVNLSRRHFENQNFFFEYENLMNKYQIEGKYIEFEITESIILNSEFNLTETIRQIHKIGSKVSIDDFGSGFSNFSMINHVDYDILKIDRKLLFGKNGFDDDSRKILKNIVSLNKDMNKIVVCEGVEEKEESDYLKSIGCDLIQGYYYSKPQPKEEFSQLIQKTNEGVK